MVCQLPHERRPWERGSGPTPSKVQPRRVLGGREQSFVCWEELSAGHSERGERGPGLYLPTNVVVPFDPGKKDNVLRSARELPQFPPHHGNQHTTSDHAVEMAMRRPGSINLVVVAQ